MCSQVLSVFSLSIGALATHNVRTEGARVRKEPSLSTADVFLLSKVSCDITTRLNATLRFKCNQEAHACCPIRYVAEDRIAREVFVDAVAIRCSGKVVAFDQNKVCCCTRQAKHLSLQFLRAVLAKPETPAWAAHDASTAIANVVAKNI